MSLVKTRDEEADSSTAPQYTNFYVQGLYHPGVVVEWDKSDKDVCDVEFRPGSSKAMAELFVDERGQLDPRHSETIVYIMTDRGQVSLNPSGLDFVSFLQPEDKGYFGFGGQFLETEDNVQYRGPHAFTWEKNWLSAGGTKVTSMPFSSCFLRQEEQSDIDDDDTDEDLEETDSKN